MMSPSHLLVSRVAPLRRVPTTPFTAFTLALAIIAAALVVGCSTSSTQQVLASEWPDTPDGIPVQVVYGVTVDGVTYVRGDALNATDFLGYPFEWLASVTPLTPAQLAVANFSTSFSLGHLVASSDVLLTSFPGPAKGAMDLNDNTQLDVADPRFIVRVLTPSSSVADVDFVLYVVAPPGNASASDLVPTVAVGVRAARVDGARRRVLDATAGPCAWRPLCSNGGSNLIAAMSAEVPAHRRRLLQLPNSAVSDDAVVLAQGLANVALFIAQRNPAPTAILGNYAFPDSANPLHTNVRIVRS